MNTPAQNSISQLSLTLPPQAMQAILNCLSQQPYQAVHPVINEAQSQFSAQLKAQTEAQEKSGQATQNEPPLSLSLPVNAMEDVLTYLGQQPYHAVQAIIAEAQKQFTAQLNAQAEAQAAAQAQIQQAAPTA